MIRRETNAPDGTAIWVLIDQRSHAKVAGKLADHWKLDPLASEWQDLVRWTAEHHDDGWESWDRAPGLDHEGRPLSFLEMEVADSNAIWTDSILAGRRHSPWSAFLIARHFLELRAGASSAEDPGAIAFEQRFHPLTDAWLAEGIARENADPAIGRQSGVAVEWLQLFDWLSLLLCCRPLERPTLLPVPGVTELRLTAIDAWNLQLTPWPLAVPELSVSAEARQVVAGRYRDSEELCHAARPLTITWHLTPGQADPSEPAPRAP